jgi:hypothetical protein
MTDDLESTAISELGSTAVAGVKSLAPAAT